MRLFMILCWLMVPVLAWAYHLGPGQTQLKLDDSSSLLRQASLAAAKDDFTGSRTLLSEALAKLPADRVVDAQVIRLELAKAQMQSGQLPEARLALDGLLQELQAADTVDEQLVAETRAALANAQYHMTWLMRLEGLPAEEWEPEIDAARQHYRLLAEAAQAADQSDKLASHQHDLESAIRLARMDLDELQALKLPSQCQGCCSGQCDKPGKKKGKKKSKKKSAGSNLGPLPDGSGA